MSKDEVITAAYGFSTGMGVWMTVIAGLTAFYMFRLYYSIFWRKEYKVRDGRRPHESPPFDDYPASVPALLTVAGGFIPFGKFVTADGTQYIIRLNVTVAAISVSVALTGIGVAAYLYRRDNAYPAHLAKGFGKLYRAASNRFYIDELYLFITKKLYSTAYRVRLHGSTAM